MCKILNVNFTDPRNKKKHIKKTLDYLSVNLKNTPFTWDFVKQGKRFAYHISFCFPKDTLDFFDERLKSVFISSLISSLKFDYIRKNDNTIVGYDIVRQIKNINEKDFLKWFFLPDNKAEKEKCFRDTYLKIYQTEYPHDKIDFDNLKLDK